METEKSNSRHFCVFNCLQETMRIKLPVLFNYWPDQINKLFFLLDPHIKEICNKHKSGNLHKVNFMIQQQQQPEGPITKNGNVLTPTYLGTKMPHDIFSFITF